MSKEQRAKSTEARDKPNYAFIDSQNLKLGIRSLGWRLDYRKLRLYLKHKHSVEKAFMFIGLVANNQKLYTYLQSAGFILIFKPTIRYFENGKETVKGNVDAELVLHAAAIEYRNYNKAIIVTGDGDFACLVGYLLENNKLLKIIAPTHKYSQLLQPFYQYIIKAEQIRNTIEHKKSQTRRSVETLGVSGNGDTNKIAKNTIDVNPKTRKAKK